MDYKDSMDIENFFCGYAQAAAWTNEIEGDFYNSTIKEMEKDCAAFIAKAGNLLDTIEPEQAGHDFWLTRNHHGAGFWDRGLGEIGEKLTDLAHSFGEVYLDEPTAEDVAASL